MIYIAMNDGQVRDRIVENLHHAGHGCSIFSRAGDCFFAIGACAPELLIIGDGLPDADALELLRHLRADGKTTALPVMVVWSTRSTTECKAALDSGADDFVGGDFDMDELLSRIGAVLRRVRVSGSTLLEFEGITLDDDHRRVLVDGKPSMLTYTEYEILKLLIRDPGEVLTRSRILERVWGTSSVGETRAVDMHIAALRRKLGRHGTLIQTMRGTGYMLSRGAS